MLAIEFDKAEHLSFELSALASISGEGRRHQCFDGLLDPPWTSWGQLGPAGASWCQLVQHPKVSKLPCPQAMSKSSTTSSQSDNQQAGKFHKLGKSIW